MRRDSREDGKYLGWADTVNTPSQTNTFPLKVPASISREKASTVPLAAATVWLALFSKDCLNTNRSNAKGTSVLLAMIYGLDVITTCRPHNEDLVRSCGAKHVFDYNDPNVIVKITEVALILQYIFDTIGNTTSSNLSFRVFADHKGDLCTVRPGKANRTSHCQHASTANFIGRLDRNDKHDQASNDDHELASELFENLRSWLEQGQVKPNKSKVLLGLDSVPQGFQGY
ncbi:Polyketide synthase enoylreductase [Penicillium expansum]|nr:Polyketide synthase enoylreductase [Penicillium expansum]